MTDAQLYLAICIPSALFALNFLAIIWQARGLTIGVGSVNSRIDSLERVMIANFDAAQQGLLRFEQVMDSRFKHLEDT